MMATTTNGPTALQTPITRGGIRSVHFFNGRLLSGEDLSREQDANREAHLRLGRAAGSGVAYGLEVVQAQAGSSTNPVVTVTSGLAVNRLGQTLELSGRTDVALAHQAPGGGSPADLLFSDCVPLEPATYTAGSGVYVLTIRPAQSREGRASVSGLGNEEAGCNTAFSVEGVQFRLIKVLLPLSVTSDANKARNRIAYRFLGTASSDRRRLEHDFFGPPVERYGLVDDLRANCLDDREVPLAVIHWTAAAGIVFVDGWAVRRRLVVSEASSEFPLLAGDRVEREGEAALLQFQAHLAHIRSRSLSPQTVRARDHFDFLPPTGLVPVGPGELRAFNRLTFFAGVKARDPVFIEGPELEHLLSTSFTFPPIDVTTPEVTWLYAVRSNVVAGSAATPYLIFANGQMPYLGDARFDLAYWNHANCALTA